MDKVSQWVIRHPWRVIVPGLLLTVLFAFFLVKPGLEKDPSPYLLKQDHPSRAAFDRMKKEFSGTSETVLVLVEHDQSLFNPASLERMRRLEEALDGLTLTGPGSAGQLAAYLPKLDGESRAALEAVLADGLHKNDREALEGLLDNLEFGGPVPKGFAKALEKGLWRINPVKKITGPSTAENILGRGDTLTVRKNYTQTPATPQAVARLEREITSNELFLKTLVAQDHKAAMIQVQTWIPVEDTNLTSELYDATRALVNQVPGPEKVYVAGMPVMAATSHKVMDEDNKNFFPIVLLIVVIMLALSLRSVGGVLLPLMVVVISILWVMGGEALLGIKLNQITAAMPVFLITIGVADGIHILSEFRDNLRRMGNRKEALALTMRHLNQPVILTSLTTAAGFLSLAYTEIEFIQIFGVVVAVGVLVALAASLWLIPAMLALGPDPKAGAAQPAAVNNGNGLKETALVLWLERVALFAFRRNRLVLAATLGVVALSVVGAARIQVKNDWVGYFPPWMEVVTSTHAMDRTMAGSNAVSILIQDTSGQPEPFKDPENLAAVWKLQKYLEGLDKVGRATSLTDLVRRMNFVMHEEKPAYNTLPGVGQGPQGRQLVSQFLLLYENSGGDALADYVTQDYAHLRVSLVMATNDSVEVEQIIRQAKDYMKANLPPHFKASFAGGAEMSVTTNNEVVNGQVFSLLLSLLMVFLLLLVSFRSLSKGLLGIIPLSFTVLLNFGVMGLLGIPLNIGTAIVSSIVIGIGVDYAIHYLARLQLELDRGLAAEPAIVATMISSGKAIFANAVVVSLGFIALIFSLFTPMREVGWMVSQTLMVSGLATLVLLPAAAGFFKPAFLSGPAK